MYLQREQFIYWAITVKFFLLKTKQIKGTLLMSRFVRTESVRTEARLLIAP